MSALADDDSVLRLRDFDETWSESISRALESGYEPARQPTAKELASAALHRVKRLPDKTFTPRDFLAALGAEVEDRVSASAAAGSEVTAPSSPV